MLDRGLAVGDEEVIFLLGALAVEVVDDIGLKQQARVIRVAGNSLLDACQSLRIVAVDVAVGEGEVAVDDVEGRIQVAGSLPQADGLGRIVLVAEVAQVVRSLGVLRIGGDGMAEHVGFFRTERVAVVVRGLGALLVPGSGGILVTGHFGAVTEGIEDHRVGAALVGDAFDDSGGLRIGTGVDVVRSQFKIGLGIVAHPAVQFGLVAAAEDTEFVQGHVVDLVLAEDFLQEGGSFGVTAHLAEDEALEVQGDQVLGIGGDTALDVVEGVLPILALAVNLGELQVGGGVPVGIPGGAVEHVIGLFDAAQVTERQAEVVEGLAVARTGVTHGDTLDGLAEIGFGLLPVLVLVSHEAELVVDLGVARIAAEGFLEVRHRIHRAVELVDAQAGEVEFLDAFDLGGLLVGGQRLGTLIVRLRMLGGSIVVEQVAVVGIQEDVQVLLLGAGGQGHVDLARLGRADGHRAGEDFLAGGGYAQAGGLVGAGGVEADIELGAVQEVVHRTGAVGIDQAVQVADREPDHGTLLGLIRLEPAVVRLVVGIETGHQFDITTGIVGQAFVGLQTARVVAVGPVFHARADIVVAHPCGAGFQAVVIAAEIVLARIPGEEGHGGLGVDPAADVQAGVVVAVEIAVSDRPGGHAVLAVVGDVFHTRREDDLVVLVAAHGRVGPEQEGVGHFRGVARDDGHLDEGGVRPYGVADQHVGALEPFLGVDPDGLAAVLVLLDDVFHVLDGGRTVVVGIAPGQGTGPPVAHHTDQGRFDDGVVVEPIVAVGLVIGIIDTAALLGGDGHADIVVLDKYHVVVDVLFVHGQAVVEGIGVHAALDTLVVRTLIEARHRVRGRRHVCRDGLRTFSDLQLGGSRLGKTQHHGSRAEKG